MKYRSACRRLAAAAAIVALTTVIAPSADASKGQREGVDYINPDRPHCVSTIYGAEHIESGGDARMKNASCYATFDEAQAAAQTTNTHRQSDTGYETASFSYQAIGVHCDGLCNGASATLTTNGTDCNGGGLVFSSTWDDRVDQNRHKKCYQITLYAVENYTGGCSTFGTMNTDRTPCVSLINSNEAVKYFGPEN